MRMPRMHHSSQRNQKQRFSRSSSSHDGSSVPMDAFVSVGGASSLLRREMLATYQHRNELLDMGKLLNRA